MIPFRKSVVFKRISLVTVLAAGVSLGACTIEYQPRGFFMDQEFAEGITPGLDTLTSVQTSLGNPSIKSTFETTTWYYISAIAKRKSFLKPSTIEREILAVNFDQKGLVESVDKYTLADGRSINPVNDETPTRGKKLGVFEQIFSNIGRFANTPGQGPL